MPNAYTSTAVVTRLPAWGGGGRRAGAGGEQGGGAAMCGGRRLLAGRAAAHPRARPRPAAPALRRAWNISGARCVTVPAPDTLTAPSVAWPSTLESPKSASCGVWLQGVLRGG